MLQTAQAEEWSTDYGMNLSVGRDDNFRLSESDELKTTSSRIGVFASVDGATEISKTSLALGASGSSYSESEIDDSTSYTLSLDTSRTGERLSGNLGLAFANQSTTETELLDTGAVIDGERESASLTPGLRYRLDERNTLTAGFSASDVTYDTVSLTEYTDNAVYFGWNSQRSETSGYSVTLRTSEYDPEDDDTTDIDSVSIGYNMSTSEATGYTFSLGYSEVSRPSDSETGNDYAIEINHQRDERNSFVIAIANSYVASGAGEVRDEDSLDLYWNHALSDRTSVNASAQRRSNDDRDYTALGFGASYQYSREVSLGADLRYREQDSDTVEADSTSFFFSLSYSPI